MDFTPKPQDLGQINLALHLTLRDQTAVEGWVIPDETLVFPEQEGRGPDVKGRLVFQGDGGADMALKSGEFSGGELSEDRPIKRNFGLTTKVSPNGAELAGEYFETITGFGPEPVTVVGTFVLKRPVFDSLPEATPTAEPAAPGAFAFGSPPESEATAVPAAPAGPVFGLAQSFGRFSWFERIFVDSSYTGLEERGAVEQPYKTIRAAYENAPPLSTIVIRVGTYDESPVEFQGKLVDWEVEGKGLVILK